LATVPELRDLAATYRPTPEALRALYTRIMGMDQSAVDALLTPLLMRLRAEEARRAFSRGQPEYWVLRADALFSCDGHRDRGLFSLLLLNLVHLLPGEAIYLPAGKLHTYLLGSGVEIMASSNNVLRGGLTPKHTDVDELLRILTFQAGEPEILGKGLSSETAETVVYETLSPEFTLARLRITAARPYTGATGHSLNLGIVMQGDVVVSAPEVATLALERGGVFLIPGGLCYRLSCPAQARLFIAGLPDT